MSKLPDPLRTILDETPDEAALQRVWRGVRDRRRPRRASALRIVIPALAAATAALVVGLWLRPAAPPAAPAPLAVQGGDALATLLSARDVDHPLSVRLSDRSRLELSAGARLAVGENRAGRIAMVLHDGDVRFDVTPGGPRRWTIQAGALTVEVTGTRFMVSRRPDRVSVEVQRGSVRVTSEHLEPAVRTLHAGDRVTVRTGAPAASAEPLTPTLSPQRGEGEQGTTAVPPSPASGEAASTASGEAASTGAEALAASPPGPPSPRYGERVGVRGDAWRRAQQDGDPARAYELLGPGGVRRETTGAADAGALLALADVARLSGHPGEAVEPLRRIVREHGGDPRAPLAAFTLGKVELGQLGDAASAAASFERAVRLGLPASLQEVAHARLVEAHARAGHAADAARWRDEYRRRFPTGAHAAAVERWAGGR